MKDNTVLYVKSEKTSTFEHSRPVADHYCTDADRATQTIYTYKPEDQMAIDLLKEAGIVHKLIDLSNCPFSVRLKVIISRINETPALILNDRKIKGIENIRQVLQEIKT